MSLNSEMTALADAIREKSGEEGLLSISAMTEAVESIPVLRDPKEYYFAVYDYDGTVLFESEADDGDEFTLPTPPSHDGLVFDGWSGTKIPVSDTVTIDGDDVLLGATYHTSSGSTELFITLTAGTGLTVTFPSINALTGINWGDGTSNQTLSHTYSDYGDYVIKITGPSTLPAYLVGSSANIPNTFLKEVRFSTKVTTLSQNVFNNCTSLEKVCTGNKLKSIQSYAFKTCRSLKSITLPSTVTTLSSSAFTDCYSLESAVLSENILTVPTSVFSSCPLLTRLVLPTKAKTVSGSIIANNVKIKRVILPDTVTSLSNDFLSSNRVIEEVRLSSALTSFGNNVFSGCYALRELTVPSLITELKQKFCDSCFELRNISLPEGLLTIGNSAFNNCIGLESITIPSTVTSIGSSAFTNCCRLATIDFSSHTSVPTVNDSTAFDGIPADCRILVPAALYDEWVEASYWPLWEGFIVPVGEIPEQSGPFVTPSSDGNHSGPVGTVTEMLIFGTSYGSPAIYVSNGSDREMIMSGTPVTLSGVSGTVSFFSDEYDNGEYVMYSQYESSNGGSITFTAPGTYEIYGEITVDGETYRTGKQIYTVS